MRRKNEKRKKNKKREEEKKKNKIPEGYSPCSLHVVTNR
jgi:hypothetical protein